MLMMFLVCAQEETRAEVLGAVVVVLETPHNMNSTGYSPTRNVPLDFAE